MPSKLGPAGSVGLRAVGRPCRRPQHIGPWGHGTLAGPSPAEKKSCIVVLHFCTPCPCPFPNPTRSDTLLFLSGPSPKSLQMLWFAFALLCCGFLSFALLSLALLMLCFAGPAPETRPSISKYQHISLRCRQNLCSWILLASIIPAYR